MSFSIFGGDSPPRGIQPTNNFNYSQRNSPVTIEQNVSYTRSGQLPQQIKPSDEQRPVLQNAPEGVESDEDARFLRMAHDALVATSKESNLIVDPTIQDLLARLQYALSPHGNPIKKSDSIRANENGQLMIQNFYENFPNLSNDIFTEHQTPAVQNKKSEDWNFLDDQRDDSDSPEASEGARLHPERKFPCRRCTMLFRRSSDLKRHEKQHLAIPANICRECGKGFARKDALKRHSGTQTCKRNAEKKLYHGNLSYLDSND